VCDSREQVAERFGKANSIPYTTRYEDILEDDGVDAVSLVTPSPTHFNISKQLLEAGKDVLVEKPMTMTSAEGRELIGVAEGAGKILMVGHIFRHHSGVLEVRKRIEQWDLGDIYYMESNRTAFSIPRKDMGVLLALAIHEMDLFCYLIGQDYPDEITAITECYLSEGIEETARIYMAFPAKVKAYAHESWLTPLSEKKRELIVVGSRKSARVDYLKPQELQIFDTSIEEAHNGDGSQLRLRNEGHFTIPIEYKEPLHQELADFIHCVKTRETPRSDMHCGLRAVEMIEMVQRSVREKRTVIVDK
jgi:predicted dehydrogenase